MEGLRGEIPIGVVLVETGPLSPRILPLKNALELAIEEINRSQLGTATIKPIIADSGATPEGAASAFNKLIHQDRVTAIIGPILSGEAEGAFPSPNETG